MLRNKLSVAVALATASVTLLSGGVIAANADEPDNTLTAPDMPNAISTDAAKLTFTIHKYQSDGASAAKITADGTDESTKLNGLKKVEGVVFTLYPLPNTGMVHSGGIPEQDKTNITEFKKNSAQFVAQHTANPIAMTATNRDGVSTVKTAENPALKPQQYLVVETSTAGAKVDGNNVSVTPSQPFLITLPMPGEGGAWNWNVHAFPKNSVNKIEKTVDSSHKLVGQKTTYVLKSTIPAPDKLAPQPETSKANDQTLSKYMIIDVLDPALTLDPQQDVQVKVIAAEQTGQVNKGAEEALPDVALTVSDHYTVELTKNNNVPDGHFVTVKFTDAGLAKLAEAYKTHAGSRVQVVLTPTITKNVAKNEADKNHIDNVAYLIPGNNYNENKVYEGNPTPDTPKSQVPKIYFGNVTLKKVDKDSTSTGLKGAKFQLWYCTGEGTPQKPYVFNKQVVPEEGTALAQDESYDSANKLWVSGDNGVLKISGLSYNNENTDAIDSTTQTQKYCLKEVISPAGYATIDTPVYGFDVAQKEVDLQTTPILNSKTTGSFNLPLTGSSALVISGLLGAGIAASGVLFLVMRKRKENAEA